MLWPDSQLLTRFKNGPAHFKAGRPVLKLAAHLAGASAIVLHTGTGTVCGSGYGHACGTRQRIHEFIPAPQQLPTMSSSRVRLNEISGRREARNEQSYSFWGKSCLRDPCSASRISRHKRTCMHSYSYTHDVGCRICSKSLPPVLC